LRRGCALTSMRRGGLDSWLLIKKAEENDKTGQNG
jgi:hypothetical protein